MHGLCVQEQPALLAEARERGEVFEVFEVNGGVDLDGVVRELAEYVVERGEYRGQAVNAAPLRELASRRTDRVRFRRSVNKAA